MNLVGINFPWKYLPVVILFLLIGAVAFYYYQDGKKTAALLAITNEQLQQSNLELGRAHTTITDQAKVQKVALQKLNDALVKEIKDRKALVMMYAELQAKYEVEKHNVKVITQIVYKDREVPIEPGTLFYKDKDGKYNPVTAMRYNYEDFRITIQGDAVKQELTYKLHQQFKVQFVETKLPTGARNHYAKLYELDDKGQNAGELQLTSFEVLRSEEMPAHFMWWDPKLDVALWGGANTKLQGVWGGDLGISIMAYGKTDNDISWKFLRLGVGATRFGFEMSFAPVQYNIGVVLPLVSNLWLTPLVGYDFGASAPFGAMGLSVVF